MSLLFDWPFVGVALAFALSTWLWRSTPGPRRWNDPAFMLGLLWPTYLVHQFEEHGIDLLGRHFAFLEALCSSLGHALDGCPADATFIFVVNVVACQLVFAITWALRRTRPLVAAFGWSVPLVNAVAHLGSAASTGAYNPGVLTGVLLFLPLGGWTLRVLVKAKHLSLGQIPVLLGAGVVLHAVLMGSLQAAARGVLSRELVLVINALNGFVPLVCGLAVDRWDRRRQAG